uniref:Thiamin biosynthesis protein S n=1 Tax=Leiomenia cribrosa TaxID=217483 RepID=A0A4D6WUF4_9FLOR|nr:Thiamin biosynthesis protein S [Leiomenia cribrosa]
MNNYYTIFVNGEALSYFNHLSLYDLLLYLNFDINRIIVEYNQAIISNNKFKSINMVDKDRIEVITIVGGG